MKPAHQFLSETVCCSLLIIALIYNVSLLMNGPKGQRALAITTAEYTQSREKLEVLKKEGGVLAQKFHQLSGQSPNDDLLDERIRKLLNYAEEEEFVLYTNKLDMYLNANGL